LGREGEGLLRHIVSFIPRKRFEFGKGEDEDEEEDEDEVEEFGLTREEQHTQCYFGFQIIVLRRAKS